MRNFLILLFFVGLSSAHAQKADILETMKAQYADLEEYHDTLLIVNEMESMGVPQQFQYLIYLDYYSPDALSFSMVDAYPDKRFPYHHHFEIKSGDSTGLYTSEVMHYEKEEIYDIKTMIAATKGITRSALFYVFSLLNPVYVEGFPVVFEDASNFTFTQIEDRYIFTYEYDVEWTKEMVKMSDDFLQRMKDEYNADEYTIPSPTITHNVAEFYVSSHSLVLEKIITMSESDNGLNNKTSIYFNPSDFQ